jgi:hypothetical protein
MKTKNKVKNCFVCILVVLAALLCLTGCNRERQDVSPTAQPPDRTASSTDSAGAAETAKPTPAAVEYDPADDFQTRFGTCTGLSVWENDEIMLFSMTSYNYIGYYDKASDTFGVLCGKPECMHDLGSNNNSECNGYALMLTPHITAVNGRIYFVALDPSDPKSSFLYSEKMDGTDRREELRIPGVDVVGSVQDYYLHRGYLYMCSDVQEVQNGEPLTYTRFARMRVDTGDYEVIFEGKNYSNAHGMRFVGDSIYMFDSSYLDIESIKLRNVIMRLDARTGELETVLDREVDSFDKVMFRLWVDEEENVFYSVLQQPGIAAVVYKVENGEPVPFLDFADDDILFETAMFSDGIIPALGMKRNSETSEVVLWIRDFEGNTVYKGEMPVSFAEELGLEDFGYFDIQGDKNTLYIVFSQDITGSLTAAPAFCCVRFEIVSPTELSGHLVFKSAE